MGGALPVLKMSSATEALNALDRVTSHLAASVATRESLRPDLLLIRLALEHSERIDRARPFAELEDRLVRCALQVRSAQLLESSRDLRTSREGMLAATAYLSALQALAEAIEARPTRIANPPPKDPNDGI